MTGSEQRNEPTAGRARVLIIVLALLSAGYAWTVAAAAPSLGAVLRRVERYVVAYEPELSTLVAREQYVQTMTPSRGNPETNDRPSGQTQARTLVSDFLFLRLPGEEGPWLGFRDVLEVDGQPIENHTERLHDIVASSPGDATARAVMMARENARYNLGRLVRTVNVPIGVVAWMHPRVRDRFSFKQVGEEEIDGTRAWRIEFKERRHPTIVRTPGGGDVASSGCVWIEPESGQVLQTELRNTLGALRVTIEVRFRRNQDFGVLVPWRMHERYEDGDGLLETEAVYSDFRRFGVTTRIR